MFVPDMFMPIITQAILLLCGYRSFKALESTGEGDDKQWLTFWLVYTFLAFAKAVLDWVSFVVPFYNEANIAIIVYLAFFGGATQAYGILKPFLKEHEKLIDAKMAEAHSQAQGYAKSAMGAAQDAMKKQS